MPEAGAAYLNRFWMKVGLRHAHKWTNCELWYNTYKTLESQLMNGKYAIHLPATYDDVVSTFKSGKFIMTQEWLDKMDLTKDDFIVKAYDIPNKVSYYGFSPSNSTYQYSVVALVDNKDKAMMMRLSIEDNKKIDESMIKKVRKRKVIADIKK
jgi:hypothetical protein